MNNLETQLKSKENEYHNQNEVLQKELHQ